MPRNTRNNPKGGVAPGDKQTESVSPKVASKLPNSKLKDRKKSVEKDEFEKHKSPVKSPKKGASKTDKSNEIKEAKGDRRTQTPSKSPQTTPKKAKSNKDKARVRSRSRSRSVSQVKQRDSESQTSEIELSLRAKEDDFPGDSSRETPYQSSEEYGTDYESETEREPRNRRREYSIEKKVNKRHRRREAGNDRSPVKRKRFRKLSHDEESSDSGSEGYFKRMYKMMKKEMKKVKRRAKRGRTPSSSSDESSSEREDGSPYRSRTRSRLRRRSRSRSKTHSRHRSSNRGSSHKSRRGKLIIKSPSDTAIYAPAVAQYKDSDNGCSPTLINQRPLANSEDNNTILDMLKSIRLGESTDGHRSSTRDGYKRSGEYSGRYREERERCAERERAEARVIEAEKFKADLENSGELKRKLVPETAMVTDNDDRFMHLTCHVDKATRLAITRGEFVELEKLLRKNKFKRQKLTNRWEVHNKDGTPFFTPQ